MAFIGAPPAVSTARLTGSIETRSNPVQTPKKDEPNTYVMSLDEIIANGGSLKGAAKGADSKKAPPRRSTCTSDEDETADKKTGKSRGFFRRLFGRS